MTVRQHDLCQALVAIGVFFFVLPFFLRFFLPAVGHWFDRVELPIMFHTTAIALPSGEYLTFNSVLGRTQRYGVDRQFRNGWFVPAAGGLAAVGATRDGRVVVCPVRSRAFLIYEIDGQLVARHESRFCHSGGSPTTGILQPSDLPIESVDLVTVGDAVGPLRSSLIALVLGPLWSPVVAWLIAFIGYLGREETAAPSDKNDGFWKTWPPTPKT